MKCQDPRDKIYAHLGTAMDREELGIDPDYSAPVEKVFIEFAAVCLQKTNRLRILDYITLEEIERSFNVPSWVPDYSKLHLPIESTRPAKSSRPRLSLSADLTTLNVYGLYCATVRTVYGTLTSDMKSMHLEELQHICSVLSNVSKDMDDTDARDTLCCYAILRNQNKSALDEYAATKAMQGLWKVMKDSLKRPSIDEIGRISLRFDSLDYSELPFTRHLLFYSRLNGYTICLTDDKRPCRSNAPVKEGDIIANFLGGNTLYVLRPIQGGKFQYVGLATIPGLMEGQQLDEPGWEEKVEEFSIV
jgi:hypothetical protein